MFTEFEGNKLFDFPGQTSGDERLWWGCQKIWETNCRQISVEKIESELGLLSDCQD